MILEADSGLQVKSSNATIKATISESSLPFIFRLLSQNFYSNPLGSLIREYTSNCLDSHTESGNEAPVLVRREYIVEENAWDLIFQDFGVGLSVERMLNIFMDYGNSTKRTTNEMVGGFGLGSKSGLSYQESFTILTRFEGIEYEYIYSRGEVEPTLISLYGYNEIRTPSKVYDEDAEAWLDFEEVTNIPIGIETEEPNGTQIRIRVKQSDNYNLEGHVKKQLAYFQNINFKGFSGLTDDYTIYELRTFFYRPDVNTFANKLHIALGQVAYPINFQTLGIDEIHINAAVKFQIGELKVTPNREELIYEQKYINLIKQRIDEFRIELKLLADKQAGVDTMKEYQEKYNKEEVPVTLTDGVIINVYKKYLPDFRFIFNPVPEIRALSRYVFSHFFTHHAIIYDKTYSIITGSRSDQYGDARNGAVDMIVTDEDEESPIANKYNLAYLREKGFAARQLNIFKLVGKDKIHKDIVNNIGKLIGHGETSKQILKFLPMKDKDLERTCHKRPVLEMTYSAGKEWKKNKDSKKVIGKFVAYILNYIKDNGIFFKDNMPDAAWIEDYKERTKIVRVKKPPTPVENMVFNCMIIDHNKYESIQPMTFGEIAKYKYVVYCNHSVQTNTAEKKWLSDAVRALTSRKSSNARGRMMNILKEQYIFISISQSNYDALESKGLVGNFVYYQDLFQLPLFKRVPQHIHYARQHDKVSGRIADVQCRLAAYGDRFQKDSDYYYQFMDRFGYDDKEYLKKVNLDPFNLPYITKDDYHLNQIYAEAAVIRSNPVSRMTLEILDNMRSYGTHVAYQKALLLSVSQIKGLHEKRYSRKYIKTLTD